MPELPEVETIKNSLIEKTKNSKIEEIHFYKENILKNSTVTEFKEKLLNNKLDDFKRIGKTLLIEVGEYTLAVSLRMEGKFFIDNELQPEKHTIFILKLTTPDKRNLYLKYEDVRKFSTIHITKSSELHNLEPIKKIGMEPFDNELTPQYLQEKWAKKNKAIKAVILEQNIISGIGNIYADEILFACKIHPMTPANSIGHSDLENVIKETRRILEKAIKLKGSTIRSYTSLDGSGTFQEHLKAYGRSGQECLICNTKLEKIRVGGRGTTFCTKCQQQK